MSCNTTPNFHQESFRIKHEDEKFIRRLLSKEISSKSEPSFRVYYGDVPSAVPFTWETAPGTPKHKSYDDYVPPLTPPPSYYTNNLGKCSKQHYSRSKILLHTLLRRMKVIHSAKSDHSPASSSYSSMSSPSWTSSDQSSRYDQTMSTKAYDHRRRSRSSSFGSCFRDNGLCFGFGKDNVKGRIKGGYLKKALLSIVGRRSA